MTDSNPSKDRVAHIRFTVEDMKRHGLRGMIPQEEAIFLLDEIEKLQSALIIAREALEARP